jgi:signal transduction histidine kinase
VLNDSRTELAEFITVGLEPEAETLIGPRPKGKGVLGLLITEPNPLRLSDLGDHTDSHGFPPNHPPMTSFLGVPVTAHGEVYGNLYLTDKIGWSEFTHDDEDLVKALAQAAGIAIENARLHQRVQEIAVFDDRDRIARDLHDAVIQRLFAIGLSLQGLTKSVTSPVVGERLNRAIADLDTTIRQIRTSIFELSLTPEDDGVRARVLALARELDAVVGFEVQFVFDGPSDSAIHDDVGDHLLFTLREALTNVGRHAEATKATVTVGANSEAGWLIVSDNGRGLGDPASDHVGLGLANMRHRAEKLGGELLVESSSQGTTLDWRVPLIRPGRSLP